jgi:sugar phosphate isomerase/epimerase
MSQIPVGLQLWSVHDECVKDFPATIAAVAKIGYQAVEFAGYHGRTANEVRKMLDDNGIRCCGTHLQIGTILGDELKKTIEFNQVLGNTFLIVAAIRPVELTKTRADWRMMADNFNEAAVRAKAAGMRVGFHNHWDEFKPVEGEMPWDTIFENTTPDVIMQLDTGNALMGDTDPVQFLRKYPGRATTVHLKDHKKGQEHSVFGEGQVPWDDVLCLCETTQKTQWYIIEQESAPGQQLATVKQCFDNLKAFRAKTGKAKG